jgi:hypothetical protein
VHFQWSALLDAKDGYNVWMVMAKQDIPLARAPGLPPAVAICVPTAVPSCDHLGAVPGPAGTVLFYQARALCGTNEGP